MMNTNVLTGSFLFLRGGEEDFLLPWILINIHFENCINPLPKSLKVRTVQTPILSLVNGLETILNEV